MSLQSLLEPFSKLLSFVIQNAVFTLAYLVELCGLCYRAFTKVTMKLYFPLGTTANEINKRRLSETLLRKVFFSCGDDVWYSCMT